MLMYLKCIASMAIVVGVAIGLNHLTHGRVDAETFIACSALWWGIRAYYRDDEVNTAHNQKVLED